ncbi:MAG TPA: hypothetical protein VGH44_06075 [Candidatus Saccharimonadia bacterium]
MMIFFDATGKRWRKIKLSAAGITVLAVTPMALLGVGAVVYQPKWSQLPVARQAQNLIDQAATIATQQVAAATHPSPAPSPATATHTKQPITKLSSAPVAKITAPSTPVPTPAVLSAHTSSTPHATSTPAPTTAPSTAPGNSGSHSKGTASPKH